MDGQDQPKIYTIRDHTLEVLMHADVLELHAVGVIHTPQADERQLHLKVRVRCGQEELVVDVLVDADMMEWRCVNGRFQGRRFTSKKWVEQRSSNQTGPKGK